MPGVEAKNIARSRKVEKVEDGEVVSCFLQ